MASKVVLPGSGGRYDIGKLVEAQGCEVIRLPVPEPGKPLTLTPAQVEQYFGEADAFVSGGGLRISREILEAGKKLRVGASPIIGTENIDVEAATELGIVIGFGATPENFLGVAEAVGGLSVALLKRIPAKWNVVREGGFRIDDSGRMVKNSTIGLIGFGNIGKAVARRMQGWDCELIAADPYVDPAVAAEFGVKLVDLDTLLRTADVVSIMVVLTGETRHLIGERELALMKPTSYLINTARGGCVDEKALIKALDENRLAGAAIDVWEQEPTYAENPLRTNPKVIATGHSVGHSEELHARMPIACAENILRGLRGEAPLHVRNPEVLPRWRERLARLGVTPAMPAIPAIET